MHLEYDARCVLPNRKNAESSSPPSEGGTASLAPSVAIATMMLATFTRFDLSAGASNMTDVICPAIEELHYRPQSAG